MLGEVSEDMMPGLPGMKGDSIDIPPLWSTYELITDVERKAQAAKVQDDSVSDKVLTSNPTNWWSARTWFNDTGRGVLAIDRAYKLLPSDVSDRLRSGFRFLYYSLSDFMSTASTHLRSVLPVAMPEENISILLTAPKSAKSVLVWGVEPPVSEVALESDPAAGSVPSVVRSGPPVKESGGRRKKQARILVDAPSNPTVVAEAATRTRSGARLLSQVASAGASMRASGSGQAVGSTSGDHSASSDSVEVDQDEEGEAGSISGGSLSPTLPVSTTSVRREVISTAAQMWHIGWDVSNGGQVCILLCV